MAGCAGFGNLKVRQEKDRIRHLHELIRMIRRIQGEIDYGRHTLPQICLILAQNCDAWYVPFWEEIYRQMVQGEGAGLKEIWDEQMEACLRGLPLRQEEKDIIVKLPTHLGLQEETRQAMELNQTIEWLSERCRQAEEAYENRSKMIHSVSILAGLLLSILLL